MKKLCIYVIYDKQKKVNPYIGAVLNEIKKHILDIVVVCNFDKIVEGEEYIKPYTDEVYFRENIGYDAGAYKDAMIDFLKWDRVLSYDELLLTNDTYFAPIYPFDDMFDTMERAKCDFWGITRHPKVTIMNMGEFDEHIQSYFVVFKKNVLHHVSFRNYWEEYVYMPDKEQTIINFEIGINKFLSEHGFIGISYIDNCGFEFMNQENINPYSQYVLELVKEARVPIIKKTNFYGKNRWLLNSIKAMKYIEENTSYDVSLIYEYIEEYQKKGLLGPYFDFEALSKFVEKHSSIYIYGNGVWGQIAADYFEFRGWEFKDFLVTNVKDNANVKMFLDVKIENTEGIVIAQEYKNVCDEIINYIGERCAREQIFTPCYS